MTEQTTWYTDDFLSSSYRTLFRIAFRANFIAGPVFFLIFAFLKAIGWRLSPNYGLKCPTELPIIPSDEIPSEVRDAMARCLTACRNAGFTVCYATRPDGIGRRAVYNVFMLSEDRCVRAIVVWIRVGAGQIAKEWTKLSCHSTTTAGNELTTVNDDPAFDHRFIKPSVDVQVMPLGTTPADLIAAHRKLGRGDLVQFDCDSLAEHQLKETREYIEWWIKQGFLVPLTPAEVQRLGG